MSKKVNFVIAGTAYAGTFYWTNRGRRYTVSRGEGLYTTYVGAKRVRDELSRSIPSVQWEVRVWVPSTSTSRPVLLEDKNGTGWPSSYTRNVKAFIRHNSVDRKKVVYFKRGGRMFKMLDENNIKIMATKVTYDYWLRKVSKNNVTTPVYEDEQVLYNGKPVDIHMDVIPVQKRLLDLC